MTKTIKKVKYDNAVLDEISPLGGYQGRVGSIGSAHDGESFHSPLMERIIGPSRKELFTPDEKSRRTRDRQVPSSHGRYKELANITSPEHEEPSGYYLPLSNAFKNGSVSSRRHKGCVFEGWVSALQEQKVAFKTKNIPTIVLSQLSMNSWPFQRGAVFIIRCRILNVIHLLSTGLIYDT